MLQSYELSRLSLAANLKKEIVQLLDACIEESSNAALARLLMEQKDQPAPVDPEKDNSSASDVAVRDAHSASDNFLGEQRLPKARTRTAA
jgi:hypothetical protein